MAAEVSQVPLEGQLDTDLLTFDSGGDTATNMEYPPTQTNEITDIIEEGESFGDPALKATDNLNEIDWEDQPRADGNEASLTVLELDSAADGDALTPSFDVNMGESDLHVKVSSEAVAGQEDSEANEGVYHNVDLASHAQGNTTGEEVVEHEITYDEEDGGNLGTEMEVGDVSLEYAAESGHPGDNPDFSVDAQPHGDDDDHEEIEEGQEQEQEEDEESHPEQVEAQDEQSTDDSDDDQGELPTSCPDISVNYRNSEYPLIHGQSNADVQMGFFEDVTVLDLTVDNLLSRFRQELVDDIGPQDELVLQVDELGLEYAESTHREHLSGVTLRQLHEIFDQLAKNQDPDVTRTLYTNLLIRPHPAKRLELLIDEAFNGKGLDEIIYCFQPNPQGQLGHDDSNADIHADSSDGDGGEDIEDDISGDAEEEDVSPDDDMVSEQDNDGESENEVDPSAEHHEDDIDEDQYYHGGSVDGEDATEQRRVDDLGVVEVTEEHVEILESAHDNDGLVNDLVTVEVEEVVTSNDQAYDDLTTEQPADEALDSGFDLIEMIDDDDDDDDAALEIGPGNTAGSSATATLDGHAENEIDYDDSNDVNGDANLGFGETAVAGESLDEIDWRDFPEETNDSDLKDTLGSSGKRPHSEVNDGEEFDLDGENDVKRRRS